MYSVSRIFLSSSGSSLLKGLMRAWCPVDLTWFPWDIECLGLRKKCLPQVDIWQETLMQIFPNCEFQILSGFPPYHRGLIHRCHCHCLHCHNWGCWPTSRRWLWISCRFVQKCSSHDWKMDVFFLVNARVIVVSKGSRQLKVLSQAADHQLGRWTPFCQEVQQDSNKRFYFSPKDLWWRIDGGKILLIYIIGITA